MPVCVKCQIMAATCEMRRRRPPHQGDWMCKSSLACKQRAREKRKDKAPPARS